MFKKSIFLATMSLAMTLGLFLTTNAQSGQYLGSRNVTDRVNHDRIIVTSSKGGVRRIQLRVSRRPVTFYRVVVRYATGGDDRIPLRQTIRSGGASSWLSLPGGNRRIRTVEFWYDARSIGRGTARVSLYGRS